MALNIKTLTTRTLSAIVFVAILLLGINYHYFSFGVLFFIVSVWGLFEFYKLSENLGAKPYRNFGLLSGAFLFIGGFLSNMLDIQPYWIQVAYSVGILSLFMVFVKGLFHYSQQTILNIAFTVMGIVYAVVPFVLLTQVSCFNIDTVNHCIDADSGVVSDYNPHIILGVILLIWASDSSAYLVGSVIGKTKLYERISPGKTWEGSIGASVLTMACSYVISIWYPEIAFIHWAVISVIVCVFGTIGDLVESMLKRQAGVKDSGKIMPGHGGILDRFDSLLFVSPFVYVYLNLVL